MDFMTTASQDRLVQATSYQKLNKKKYSKGDDTERVHQALLGIIQTLLREKHPLRGNIGFPELVEVLYVLIKNQDISIRGMAQVATDPTKILRVIY